jgi:hypothetical protein
MDTVNQEIHISYEVEEDLIDCFFDKTMEIAALKRKKLALIEVIYPEVWEDYKIETIRQFNKELTLISVPEERVEALKAFYKALDMKCVVSY